MKPSFEYYPTLKENLARHDHIADPLMRLSRCLQEIREEISITHPLPEGEIDDNAQVKYYKDILAPLYGELIFYYKCYRLELKRRHSLTSQEEKIIEDDFKTIQDFFTTQNRFCQYYYSGSTRDDREWYTHRNRGPLPIDPAEFEIPRDINPGCILKGCILAFTKFGDLLRNQLHSPEAHRSLPAVTFMHKDIDIVEEMLGKHASRSISIDGIPATQAQIMDLLQTVYRRKIPNWRQLLQSIRNRKKDNFLYHTQIQRALEKNQDEILDKKPGR
ncbi:MAG: RteC domain-containing protein [Bacteroidetes bacterium]|nr:RteC domain-containing protein [Bacteroidota bacterium]